MAEFALPQRPLQHPLMDFERDEGRALACCATAESDLVIEAEIDEEPDAQNIPIRDFAGRVARIEDLTPTIKGVWIELDGTEGIHFQAGPYVNLALPDDIGSRAFSIASVPAESNLIELNVRRVPGGAGTAHIHDRLAPGDPIKFTGPYGRFFVRKSANLPMIFFAGGSGLSSPRSMILDLLAEGCNLPFTLINGQRNLSELYYHAEFEALAREHGNFRLDAGTAVRARHLHREIRFRS